MKIKNANNTMNLMTKTVAKTLPPIGSTDGQGMEAVAKVKFFLGPMTWYATEFEPETGLMFGKVFHISNCPEGELGYFNIYELAELKHFAAVERDKWFSPTKLSEIKD